MQQLGEVAAAKRADTGQQLVQHGAQRIDIGVTGQIQALHLLGRHIARRTGNTLDARDLGIGHQRDAKIDDAHVVVLREHDVRWLDVAVDHAARVRVVQRLGAFVHDADHVIEPQQIVGTAIGRQRARTVHVFHHHVAMAILFTGIVDGQDVRMLQHAHHVGLGQEHLARHARTLAFTVRGHVVHLDGHVATVERIVREIHRAGTATAHLIDDGVLADALRHGTR